MKKVLYEKAKNEKAKAQKLFDNERLQEIIMSSQKALLHFQKALSHLDVVDFMDSYPGWDQADLPLHDDMSEEWDQTHDREVLAAWYDLCAVQKIAREEQDRKLFLFNLPRKDVMTAKGKRKLADIKDITAVMMVFYESFRDLRQDEDTEYWYATA